MDVKVIVTCDHDDWQWWCTMCGKPTMYENLCGCGEATTTQKCLTCEEEIEVRI